MALIGVLDRGEAAATTTTEAAAIREDLQPAQARALLAFHPVLAVTAPPCTGDRAVELLDGQVVQCYELGPAALDARGVEQASARLDDVNEAWTVLPVLLDGPEGIDAFNAIAGDCFARTAKCPTGQLAILSEGVVLSAPSVQEPRFERDQVQITGDFTEAEARQLAERLSG